MKVGYCRVSTDDQSLDIQQDQLKAAGCERIYEEKISGKDAGNRPELAKVLAFVREGDVIVVTKLDRLARNTLDMLTIITDLGERGVKFTSLAEPWANTDSPAAKLMLTMMAGVATFERERIRERQAEGIKRAKENGAYKGSKRRFDPEKIRELAEQGMGPTEIMREIGAKSTMTVYRALNETTA
ncbi:recombinase family protein [Filomicrobium sp.]|uniref:recombinase family protein n=1 Tax=Filomicrobium sp. TaxID=2024831 RepID=UPI00258B048B|nr:recombinase family protein [Filomicrobium sp.]MCV0371749.1 recombinase family protein [Filomicrobium sp.]